MRRAMELVRQVVPQRRFQAAAGDVEQVGPGGAKVVQGQLEIAVDLALTDAARFGLQLEQQVLGELRRFLGGEKATLLWG